MLNYVPLQTSMIEEPFITMISKINLIGGSEGWWVDVGASHQICYDRIMFKTYTKTIDDRTVLLGDSHTTKFVGI